MLTTEFIERAKNIHNDIYEYEINTDKVIIKDKVTAVCNKHGTFLTRIHDHIYHKSGCPNCAREKKSNKLQFVIMAQKQHGNRYDYQNVVYFNSYTPVEIICEYHGKFMQTPSVHLHAKIGCTKCAAQKLRKPLVEFVVDANKAHDNFYDYSKVKYTNEKEKVEIACPYHGIFLQTPDNHIHGKSGCPICANLNRTKTYNEGRKDRAAKEHDKGIVYLAHFMTTDEEFIKIGITTGTSLGSRFGKNHRGYAVTKIFEHETLITNACAIEKEILVYFRKKSYIPKVKFGGYTECFDVEVKDSILLQINRMIK